MLLAGLVFYFGYHGLNGEQGMLAWAAYNDRIGELEAELAIVRAERAQLENRASRLRDASLDLDLIDERARDMLNVARPDEYVIRLDGISSHPN